jgi:hypothetical protein
MDLKKLLISYAIIHLFLINTNAQKHDYKLTEIDTVSFRKYYVLTFKEKKLFNRKKVKVFTYKANNCKQGIILRKYGTYSFVLKEFDRTLITGRDPRGYIVNGKKILEHYEQPYTSDSLCGMFFYQE